MTFRRLYGAAATGAVLLALAGCGSSGQQPDTNTGNAAADICAGTATTAYPDTVVNPDTLAWLRKGEAVRFGDRQWLISGNPVCGIEVTRVGAFAGTPLYALDSDDPPFSALFFPIGDGQWQSLDPAEPLPADTLPTDSSRSGAG